MTKSCYRRILIKMSGEALMGKRSFGVDPDMVSDIALEIKDALELGVQIGVVVGGGNIFRGVEVSAKGMDRTTADYMGMLATIINACALQETLEKIGQPTRVMSAIEVAAMCEPFIRRRALHHLERGRVTILAGGTGNPFFTTDTCAALRASELDADLLVKATKVDGVYSSDPNKDPQAKLFDRVSYEDVLRHGLRIMDHAAISLCRDNHIPIIVLNIFKKGNIAKAISGDPVGTLIGPG